MAVVHVETSGEVCAVFIANVSICVLKKVSISTHCDVTLSILCGTYKSLFCFYMCIGHWNSADNGSKTRQYDVFFLEQRRRTECHLIKKGSHTKCTKVT